MLQTWAAMLQYSDAEFWEVSGSHALGFIHWGIHTQLEGLQGGDGHLGRWKVVVEADRWRWDLEVLSCFLS